jgi:hypothetical protein
MGADNDDMGLLDDQHRRYAALLQPGSTTELLIRRPTPTSAARARST